MSPLPLVWTANAQDAAATPTPAVEMPPPAGEVSPPAGEVSPPAATTLPPAAETISAPSPSTNTAAPAAVLATPEAAASPVANGKNRAAAAKGEGKDSQSDSSPFGGFESASNHGPINIKSETMSFDYKNNVVVFSGHVHADQSGSELTSNTLHVQMNKQSQIQQMIADGNDQIAGTKITVYLQTSKSEVTDPKAVIFPRESKRPNNRNTGTDPAH